MARIKMKHDDNGVFTVEASADMNDLVVSHLKQHLLMPFLEAKIETFDFTNEDGEFYKDTKQ